MIGVSTRSRATAARPRLWLLAALVLGAGVAGAPPRAFGAKLRVTGAASIDAQIVGVDDGFQVRGRLRDETGRGLPKTHVRLRLLGEDGAPLRLPEPIVCGNSEQIHDARGFADQPDEYVIDTDAAGTFCVEIAAGVERGNVQLDVEPSQHYERVSKTLVIDTSRRAVQLTFESVPRRLLLDRPAHLIAVSAHVQPRRGIPDVVLPLELHLTDAGAKTSRKLAETNVRPGGIAGFEVAGSALERVGPATLSVRFAGSGLLNPAEESVAVERAATVRLSLVEPPAPGDHDRAPLRVRASTATGGQPEGAIEALLEGQSVAVARLVGSEAAVGLRLPSTAQADVPVTLRFLPGRPWWVAGPALVVAVPVPPPSPWRHLPWIAAGAVIGIWVLRGWQRPSRSRRALAPGERTHPGEPLLELVRVGAEQEGFWGAVLDAHDGQPVAGAAIVVTSPSFEAARVLAEARSDADGRFQLPPLSARPAEGSTMQVTAEWHTTLSRPLPAPGELRIQLVSRRRALLQRLVDWARRRGQPWSDGSDPTPGQVAAMARARQEPAVAAWAEAVEHAAFGPTAPDAEVEHGVQRREPSAGAKAPDVP